MDIIKKGNKKRNILNIKFNNYNLIIIIFILFLLISLEESNCKLTKLNHISKILITIKGIGNQTVLNKKIMGINILIIHLLKYILIIILKI